MKISSPFALFCMLTVCSCSPNPKQTELYNLLTDTAATNNKSISKSDTQFLPNGDTMVLLWQEEKPDTLKR